MRRFEAGQPGSGLEFLEFHRDFMSKVLSWYSTQSFADANAVAPWTAVPAELKASELGWNARWAADELRLLALAPGFPTSDALGIFIETGIHNSFLHTATAAHFSEPIVKSFHSPSSTYFYKIHGLVQYWWDHSIGNDGLSGPRVFDAKFYLAVNADLQAAFGTNHQAATDHWINQGLPKEGRRGSREFDVQFYIANYEDLKNAFGTDYTAAIDHWLERGLPNEGRTGALEVDVGYYVGHHADIQTAFGGDYDRAIDHWIHHGLPNEGRRAALAFDVRFYVETYPDLQIAFGVNYPAALDHWVNQGIREGRKGAP
jgi:uncharacterized protein YaeQ